MAPIWLGVGRSEGSCSWSMHYQRSRKRGFYISTRHYKARERQSEDREGRGPFEVEMDCLAQCDNSTVGFQCLAVLKSQNGWILNTYTWAHIHTYTRAHIHTGTHSHRHTQSLKTESELILFNLGEKQTNEQNSIKLLPRTLNGRERYPISPYLSFLKSL